MASVGRDQPGWLGEYAAHDGNSGRAVPGHGVQAPNDAGLTQAQVALAQNIVEREFIGPMVSKLGQYRLMARKA
jgi:hypothetical protein